MIWQERIAWIIGMFILMVVYYRQGLHDGREEMIKRFFDVMDSWKKKEEAQGCICPRMGSMYVAKKECPVHGKEVVS